jgi:AraC-like DNA-binding protein
MTVIDKQKISFQRDDLMNSSNLQPLAGIDRSLSTLVDRAVDLSKADRPPARGLPPRKLSKALQYMHQHLAEEMSLEAIATHIHISQFYFCRLFKQSMGVTPYQYLLQQRVERAKQLLLQDELSIAEIALEVGFANQSHFCVQFKRWVGISPKQFARQA